MSFIQLFPTHMLSLKFVLGFWHGIAKGGDVRDRAPGPFFRMLGQTHVNGWSRVIASQNGGSTSYIFPL